MYDYEGDEIIECTLCAAPINLDVERGFALSDVAALCMACAAARGGVYDEERDEWVREPRVVDLLEAQP